MRKVIVLSVDGWAKGYEALARLKDAATYQCLAVDTEADTLQTPTGRPQSQFQTQANASGVRSGSRLADKLRKLGLEVAFAALEARFLESSGKLEAHELDYSMGMQKLKVPQDHFGWLKKDRKKAQWKSEQRGRPRK